MANTGCNSKRFAGLLLPIAMAVGILPLGGCDNSDGVGTTDRERLLNRCTRLASRGPATQDQVQSLCKCTTDRLAEEGMSAMDMITDDRAKEITRECAVTAGIPHAQQ